MSVTKDSLAAFTSNYNVVCDRFTFNEDQGVITLAEWRRATGQDANSIRARDVSDVFASFRDRNFHLSPTSPAVRAGDRATATPRDLAGIPRPPGSAPSVGAFEFTRGLIPSTTTRAATQSVRGGIGPWFAALTCAALLVGTTGSVFRRARRRGLDRWLPTYVKTRRRRRPRRAGEATSVLICIADHYEPSHGGVDHVAAARRVRQWTSRYPQLFARFRDADGRPPQHSFFYPLEEYRESEMQAIAELCRSGFGEVEVHLHHDHDTSANLRTRLAAYKHMLADRHGLLARRRQSRAIAYGFIHGNWALDNSRPDGRWCGVNDELDVLRDTGCYADFTLPSAPSPTQTRKINSIYYALDDPQAPRSHDWGIDVGVGVGAGVGPQGGLMLIQGPLLFDWDRRKYGVVPRIENACIQENQAPTAHRLDLWVRARIGVPSRPDWVFVKLHTHGAPEGNQRVLLGDPMVSFHEELARRAHEDPTFRFHYVTAREMYNLAKAAEAGWTGSVREARDYELVWEGSPFEKVEPRVLAANS